MTKTKINYYKILKLTKNQQKKKKILTDLTRILTFNNSENIINATKTIKTLINNLIKKNQQKNKKKLSLFK